MRLAALLALFFCSGMCGLIYQVLWLRLLSLVFGVTVYAASTVLAAFMTGLAIGSAIAPRVLARWPQPLRIFAGAEILIGLSALVTPFAIDAAAAVYAWLFPRVGGSLPLLTLARLCAGFVVLLIPTVLMGMTLPVLSASSVMRSEAFGARLSALYAVNTAGAVTGAVLTGYVLIGAIGIQRSFLLGAAINVAVGIAALLLAQRVEERRVSDPELAVERTSPSGPLIAAPSHRRVEAFVVVSGFAALALEIVWFRTLVQYLAATTYAFTVMLAMVLVGIAIGGGVAAVWLRRPSGWSKVLIRIQFGTAIAALAGAWFLGWSYARDWNTGAEWQASAAAILPVSVLMGLSFPIALHLAVTPGAAVVAAARTRRVARLYALNVFGAIAGALAGGFVLLPLLGARRALIALAATYAASALLLVNTRTIRVRTWATGAAFVLIFSVVAGRVPDPFDAAYARRYGRELREFWREEGVQTAVSVHASQFRRSLYLDGLHQANDTPDMVRLHRIIGHLPMTLHPSPRRALVIGLGGGATAGAVSQHTGTHVQVVELSSSVRNAAPFFAHVNYDLLNRPNVDVRIDDGRNFLLLSPQQFDVITADIIQPIHAGAGNLYSREYFSLLRNRLADGGLVLQWVGHRPPTQYGLIVRTFLSVFPQSTLWFDGNLLVGALQPLRLSEADFRSTRADAQTAAALDDIGLRSFHTLTEWFTAGPQELRTFVGGGPVLTDDRPLLEYHRSLPRDDGKLDLSGLRSDVGTIVAQNQRR